MVPGGNRHRSGGMIGGRVNSNLRQPPAWPPDRKRESPSRHYARDLLLWSVATEIGPHQQAAVTVLQLGGAAMDLTREMSPTEFVQGGTITDAQGQ